VSAETPVLTAEKVERSFTRAGRSITALDGVSIRVPRGRVVGLIGPDGAGKTTFMRLSAGLLRPDAGRIHVFGHDTVTEALKIHAMVGYMPQRFGLYEDLSVGENLDLYADLQGVPPASRPERYRELMGMTGLGPFTSRLAGRLSGGMKQKLGLACTLVDPPELLLLDEPTVGVDPVSRRELWDIVYRLVRDQGMTVLLSTAYMDEAERCDELVLLHEGRVLDQGPPAEFRAEMDGLAFAAESDDQARRGLQRRLGRQQGVVDAVIEREWVRVVVDRAERADALARQPDLAGVRLRALPPRFEDAFVARLRHASGAAPAAPAVEQAHAATDGVVIRVEGLGRRFGDFQAVNNLSFDVNRGEVFGLLGANGAGKTTTFRMLCGLLPPTSGQLGVAGVDLRRAAAKARARIGYVSQKFALYGNLTVRQNLGFFAGAYNLRGRRRRERIDWALADFDLGSAADAESDSLPLGYKQRLALACALMHEPEIVFLDEPTSGVDPLARREFWQRINALAEQGVTVLVTTHFLEEADYCDRLVIMAAGEVLALGTPAEVKRRSAPGDGELPTMEEAFIALVQARQGEAA
jgi:ABC-2 type transport system ATP-binding protein